MSIKAFWDEWEKQVQKELDEEQKKIEAERTLRLMNMRFLSLADRKLAPCNRDEFMRIVTETDFIELENEVFPMPAHRFELLELNDDQ